MNQMNFQWEDFGNQAYIDQERENIKRPIGDRTYKTTVKLLGLDDLSIGNILKDNPEINDYITIRKYEPKAADLSKHIKTT